MMFFYGAMFIIGLALSLALTVSEMRKHREGSRNLYRAHHRQRARTTIITPSRYDPLVVGEVTLPPKTARIRDLPEPRGM